jgi:nitrite reductase/ring-hydroxylating ferredoxin subunit
MEQRLVRLEDWARAQYPAMGEVSHRWSGQILETMDYMPFSGRSPGEDNIYLHTGDAGQGLTNAVAGSLIIAPLITGQHARFAPVFDPGRVPLSGRTIAHYISDQAGAFAAAIGLEPGEVNSVHDIAPGEGALLREGLTGRIAAYRQPGGGLVRLAAACTHAGCTVHWNSFEKCWDCPCHGSQFAPDGEVLCGPAVKALQRI